MRFVISALSLALLAYPAWAQSTPPPQTSASGSVLGDLANVVFDEVERRVIKEHFEGAADKAAKDDKDDDDDGKGKKGKKDKKDKKDKAKGKHKDLPPGLAKRSQLPPGLAKRGNQLPPGLAKRDLPPELESRLKDIPDTVERVVVDNDVLLVQKGTDIILDVLENVVLGNQ